ncbi:MAG: hypothetical protein E7262_07560 [Lachnospiraceae bacterium]|nr:hypothetical protein [Lachnospiraceae bacterium]
MGSVDVLAILLIILPLYPNEINGHIYSVNLIEYVDSTSINRVLYWLIFLSFVVLGVVKIALTQYEINKGQKLVTRCSMVMSMLLVVFLGMAREPYALVVAFVLLVLKGLLVIKCIKNE